MRRGRTGLGGWRNENPRHYRPRGGGIPHYRLSRNYGILDGPRFPPPGPRLIRPPHFNIRPRHGEHGYLDHNERNQYRSSHQNNQDGLHNRSQYRDKSGPRHTYTYNQIRHKENDSSNPHLSNFYQDMHNVHSNLINKTGDVDYRNVNKIRDNQNHEKQNHNSTWPIPRIENKQPYYENQSPIKLHSGINEPCKIPVLDYPGHRPPSSDYYGGNPSPVTNNNTSFSRSVDDTVDIVRKRLLYRNEAQAMSEDCVSDPSYSMHTSDPCHSHQKNQSETPTRKKILRQKQTVKSNCDKIKNKIVHQLFKMDKDKIHKLMDNPNSSTKFEYAISNLITESQISLNRHLRSVAEKSLCSSSSDFIQNDSNTIYEDTFMKQMQCILDPQDTVLLEDMKPLVMAELSKFLEIEEYDQNYDIGISEDQVNYQLKEEFTDCHNDLLYNFNENSQKNYSEEQTAQLLYNNIEDYTKNEYEDSYQNKNLDVADKPLYERTTAIKYNDYSEERRQSSENRRKSLENKSPLEPYKTSPKSLPLFDPSTENLTEEEDPFAELDKQYHVPVDHNFIETDIYVNFQQSCMSSTNSNNFQKEITNPPSGNEKIVPNENNKIFESDTHSLTQLNLPINNKTNKPNENKVKSSQSKTMYSNENSPGKTMISLKSDNTGKTLPDTIVTKCENTSRTKFIDKKEPDKNEVFNSPIKSCTQSNSRKRSIDQRPSHRKEKRKKSESSPTQLNNDLTYENNHIRSREFKSSEKDKDPKRSCIYSYFSKNRRNKDITRVNKKIDATDKGYSDKYVRRKDISKNKKTDSTKKRTNSLTSPKDSTNVSSTPTKSDTKAKLKPINMFEEQSKKVHIHQSHRNTSLPTFTVNKSVKASNKLNTTPIDIKATENPIKRLISQETQTIDDKSNISKFSQTEMIKFVVKSVQTDPVFFERFKTNSSDTFERMKEIDLEIQVLLQEKFKLYSSLENKGSCQNSMQTLGMTVLNVTPVDETMQDETCDNVTDLSADSIVDDFTNIPVEELEEIALESIKEDKIIEQEKRTRRANTKLIEHESSSSSSVSKRSNKKSKPPNISLLEQIITDDRPLEDIIPLDEFENSPVKKKSKLKKKKASKRNKKGVAKQKIVAENFPLKDCSVVMERLNIEKWLIDPCEENNENETALIPTVIFENTLLHVVIQESDKDVIELQSQCAEIVEEDNNIQFDMLDVSEDIVISDNCEIKSHDKDMNERIDVPISEEIILDNSQSSCDDLIPSDSGQEENECKMYDYSTDENLRRDSITVTGNADAVLAIECVDNNFIAASLDGNVYHFNSDGQLINTLRGSNLAVTCLTLVKEKYGTTVYTGSLDSRIRYYDLETGVEKGPECNVLSPIQTMDRAWDTIFVGTRTGFVLQFECKNNMLIPVSTVKFSEQSILALRAMKEGPRKVLLVAARSENVTIRDAQTGLLLRTLVGPKMTVYTLLFEDGKVYCGTSSHQIHVFDYASGGHAGSHEGGKGAVCLRATGGLVFAGCYDGCVYVYREGETRPLAQLRGPSLMLLSLAVVGSKIIAGYKDRSLYIWKIPLSILQEMIL